MKGRFVVSNSKGFTLVELMLAGAIVLILIAALSPTYERYVLQSKSIEGPIALAGLYSAEQRIMAETGTYVACVFPLGIVPETKGYFIVGFNIMNNVGKEFAIVPNCSSSGDSYLQKRTVPTGNGEQELTVDNPARPDPTKDTSIIPITLLIRGRGESDYREPFVDENCVSTLTDDMDRDGVNASPAGGHSGVTRIGSWRNDTKFVACAQAALAKRSSIDSAFPGYQPTQYTINEKKEIKLINQGF